MVCFEDLYSSKHLDLSNYLCAIFAAKTLYTLNKFNLNDGLKQKT